MPRTPGRRRGNRRAGGRQAAVRQPGPRRGHESDHPRASRSAAYAAAREESSRILVEKFAPGDDYRLLVVGDKMVAAARREPAQVIGDGCSTIRQLVDEVNADPRRGDDHATVLSKIKLDPIALAVLAEQGFTPDSVPPAGPGC